MKIHILVLLFTFLCSSNLAAQRIHLATDSLSQIKVEKNQVSDVDLYNQASHFLFREQLDIAEFYINALIDNLSKKDSLKTSLGLKARLIQINILELFHERGDAIDEILQLEKDCISEEDWITLARVYLTAALAYEYNNCFSLCKNYLDKCNNLIEKHDLVSVYPRYCFRKHSYYSQLGLKGGGISHKDSVTYYIKETLTSSKKLYENHQGYYPQRQYEDFSEIYGEALKYYALIFFEEQDPRRIQYLIESKKVWERVQNDYHLGMIYRSLAQGYQKIGTLNTALTYIDSSIYYLNNGYPIDSTLYNFSSSLTYGSRASILKDMNVLDSAYYYLDLSHDFSLKFQSFTFDEKFRAVEAKNYDLILKEQESKMLQTKKWNKTLLVLLSCISILIFTIIFFYLKLQKANNLNKSNADKLLHLDQLKTNFFANVSHELRTPLTLILGPLSYMLNQPDKLSIEELKKQLTIMYRNGNSLMNLVEEILDLTKLEGHKLELTEEPTPLACFIKNQILAFKPQLEGQDIDFELKLEFAEHLHVLLDRNKMSKILNNYMSNAIKYTPVNGKIIFEVLLTDNKIKFRVTDSGIGIHSNDLPYIFDRFYQAKFNGQTLVGGTGIGLSIVKEFAKLMSGDAYAESILGKGSSFCFSLPKKIVQPKASKDVSIIVDEISENKIISVGKEFTILVVEDNVDMRIFIEELLNQHFNKVLTARNGKEGLEIIASQGQLIDLIVSDVMMPEVDGLEMLNTLKSNKDWFGIPIVMLTALSAERDRLKALMIGVDDYLTKPFSPTELLVRIQNLLFNYSQRKEWRSRIDVGQQEKLEGLNKDRKLLQRDRDWLEDLKNIVEKSIENESMSVELLAGKVFLSSRQLNRKLKLLTGLSPSKFIREVKLERARSLLEKGDFISISEVALSSGFENHSSFSVMFKTRFGKSPRAYSNTLLEK